MSYLGLACYTKGPHGIMSRVVEGHVTCSEGHVTVEKALTCVCFDPTGALSSLFYLAHEFHDDITGGILANANCGGSYRSFEWEGHLLASFPNHFTQTSEENITGSRKRKQCFL